MFLTAATLVPYLIGRGTLDANDLIDGTVLIVEAGRRNRNFKVTRSGRDGLFVKQVDDRGGLDRATVHRESVFLRSLERHAGTTSCRVPGVLDFDARRNALTMTLFEDAEDLNDLHGRLRAFPVDVAASTGTALAALHALSARVLDEADASAFPRAVPWILWAAQTGSFRSAPVSEGMKAVMQAAASDPPMSAALAAANRSWRASAPIHGDVKWDNVVAMRVAGRREIRLVDWELADLGDPLWDLAGALGAYVQAWYLSEPAVPLGLMRAPMRALWRSYEAGARWSAAQSYAAFRRVLPLIGARCMLTACEAAQKAPALTPVSTVALRVARTFLCDPPGEVAASIGFAA